MRRYQRGHPALTIWLAAIVGLTGLQSLGVSEAQGGAGPVSFIVGFDEVPSDVEPGATLHGATVVTTNTILAFAVVEANDPETFEQRAREDARVTYLEPDRADVRAYLTPSDPRWDDQYGLRQVRADVAWDKTLGSSSTKVCIVDTGVRHTHQDLQGSRWLGGYDFVGNDNNPDDANGHGTFVASVAVATTNDGVGMAGTAQASYYGVRVLSASGSGTQSDVASGIQWCADRGSHVINLSLGASSGSTTLANAVSYAWSQGSILVAAAGNDGPCSDCIGYPAAYSSVIAVTGTREGEGQWGGTSDGPEAELAAPAEGILGAYYSSSSSYVTGSGTSAAAPFVSGVAALVHAMGPHLNNGEIRDLLGATARDKGATGRDDLYGFGIVDAGAALAAIVPGPPQDLTVANGPDPDTLTLTWSPPDTVGATAIAGYRIYRGLVDTSDDLIRDDDGSAERWLLLDYADDTAIKYLHVTGAQLEAAEEAYLWVYARSYSCGLTGDSHRLYLNRLSFAAFNPCEVFPQDIAGWARFSVPVDLLYPTPLENRFSMGEVSGDWTDRNLELGIDADTDVGRTTARQNGNELEGELMWALALGPAAPVDPIELVAEVGDVLSWVDTDPPSNATVQYRVSALNQGGEGPLSNEARASTALGPPGPPSQFEAIASSEPGQIDLSWSPPSNDGGEPVTSYRVYRGPTSSDMTLLVETTSQAHADTGLQPGETYHYEVTAVTSLGEGDPSPRLAVKAPGSPTAPKAFQAQPGGTARTVYLTWQAPDSTGGFPLEGYRVYWSPTGEDPQLIAELDPTRTNLLDARPAVLTPKAHYYWVSAVNTLVEGPLSPRTCSYAGAYEQVWLTMVIECDLLS